MDNRRIDPCFSLLNFDDSTDEVVFLDKFNSIEKCWKSAQLQTV